MAVNSLFIMKKLITITVIVITLIALPLFVYFSNEKTGEGIVEFRWIETISYNYITHSICFARINGIDYRYLSCDMYYQYPINTPIKYHFRGNIIWPNG